VKGVYKIVNAEVIRTDQEYPDPLNNPAQLVLKKGTKVVGLIKVNR